MQPTLRVSIAPSVIAVLVSAGFANASFHFMQIEQVIGGVNGDTSAQAVQLRMRSAGQNFVSFGEVCVEDAAGMNPIRVMNITANVPNGNAGFRVLIASTNFVSKTNPPAVPDFAMTNLIPASYLPAGSLTFRADGGTPCTGPIFWRVSWGGASYTGSNAGAFTNDNDANFGPPFAGPLPSSNTHALKFGGTAGAPSTNNAADYTVPDEDAVFSNNTPNSFTVVSPIGACCDDATGNCTEGESQIACQNGGGRYGGNGSDCNTINPPCIAPVTGACCADATGVCTEGQTQSACQTSGGRYGGNNSTCASINPPCVAPVPPDFPIELDVVASNLPAPLLVTNMGDERLFIVDQNGKIYIVQNGQLLATPFLDITSKLPTLGSIFDERGVLGLAFHPNYTTNGKFYVRYSHPRASTGTEPCDSGFNAGCHEEILAQYSVLGDPVTSNVADPNSEVILFRVDKPQFNHNAGDVHFGPDGYLYFSLGDGGGANDGLSDNPPSHGPEGNGQNLNAALGKMLRIDVDNPQSPLPYGIPADNPFADGVNGLPEIYAWGLRNPYRFSFDDAPGGDGKLYLGEVGQDLFEEVDIVERGMNYGWVTREAGHCFASFDTLNPPPVCNDEGPLGEPLIDPIMEYLHAEPCTTDSECTRYGVGCDESLGICENEGGLAIVGGFVYRGSAYPPLYGKYVFGDFSADFGPTGRLYYFDLTGPEALVRKNFNILPGGGALRGGFSGEHLGQALKGLGRDAQGNLYVCASDSIGVSGGGFVYRIAAPRAGSTGVSPRYLEVAPPPAAFPYALVVQAVCNGSTAKYVGAPSGAANVAILVDNPANAARLNSAQWGAAVRITGTSLAPFTAYNVMADYGPQGSPALSAVTVASTRRAGDVIEPFNPPPTSDQPDIRDIVAVIDGFRGVLTALPVYRIDLVGGASNGCLPQQIINISDVSAAVDAFKGLAYVCPLPCP